MIWIAAILVIAGGAIGGVVNAIMSDNSFVLPTSEPSNDGATIWKPGIVGNALVSAVAALVSWGLYGSEAAQNLFKTPDPNYIPNFSISTIVGAILVGIGGARWLTAEVDKKMLRGAAVAAANSDLNKPLAAKLSIAPPSEALKAARDN